MHPEFVELLEYTLKKGVRVHLSTNGHYMDDHFKDIFYRCEFITFSLHDNRGYKNALKFIAGKPDWSDCTAQVSFVDAEKTTTKFLAECTNSTTLQGFDSIRLYHEHTIGGEFGNSGQDSDQERTFCPKLEHTFVVSADGQYSRCNHIWTPEQVGSLYQSTIKEIWDGERTGDADRSQVKYSILIVSTRYTRRLQAVLRNIAHQQHIDLLGLICVRGHRHQAHHDR